MNNRGLEILEFPKIIDILEKKASTNYAKELVNELLPVDNFEEVKKMQEETSEAMDVIRLKGGISFAGVKDIRSAIMRLKIGGDLSTEQLVEVASTLRAGRKIKRFVVDLSDKVTLPIFIFHVESINGYREIEEKINSCIDEYGEILDSASSELRKIRQQIRANEGKVREKLEQIMRNSNNLKKLQDPIVTIRNGRYVIPVKQEYRSAFGGLIHDQSASGATLFIEPEAVVQANNLLKEYLLKEEKEVERILKMLSNVVREEVDNIEINIENLGLLDFYQAKAELAIDMKAIKPIINNKGYVELKKARHPLIPHNQVVPIDIFLGDEYNSIVITGPNTGGKTVTLKTLGLFSLMVKAGLHIPCEEESEIAIFSSIYVDIGDEQSIEQNLSTFSGHMTNIIGILEEITRDSLVLLDELGAGTDPTEGSALAIAILEKIRASGAKVIATTHYSELKAYAYNNKDIINASVEFDVDTLRPTYRLLIGIPGRSNAFLIAKRLGLSDDIIDLAKQQINEEDIQVESMISILEKNRSISEKERQQAEKIRLDAERKNKELILKVESLEEDQYKLLQDAKLKAKEIVNKAKREAEEIISELRKMAKEEQIGIKEHQMIAIKKQLDETIPDVEKPKKQRKTKIKNIDNGDEVKVLSYGQKGSIIEKLSDSEYLVQIGIMKMKVNVDDLEIQNKKQKTKSMHMTSVKRVADVRPELDVRGKNVEEAILEIDKYLDIAFLQGYGQVTIIHGKGTGALRTGLQDFFKKHSHVKRSRLGEFGEGGSGVTVIELK